MELIVNTLGEAPSQHLHDDVKRCAHRTLGRLARRVSHAAVSLREHVRAAGRRVDVCALRLEMPGDAHIHVETLQPGRDVAITSAFRLARREMVRRRRAPLRALIQRPQPLPAPA